MKTKVIAEIGSVHDGSFGNAKKLIELAAKCGADIVKFQTHIAEHESVKNAPKPKYFRDEDRYTYFERTSFSFLQYKKLIQFSKKNNVEFLSSPFSIEAVDFLEKLNLKKYKIPSGEVNNLPLIERISKTKKEVFISSGMSNLEELNTAIKILKKRCKVTVLQCTSEYPCDLTNVGLNNIIDFKKKFKIDVGFSDHTNGSVAAVIATYLGASIIEKHFTFSRHMYGSDAKYGMEPNEFKKFIRNIKHAELIRDNPVDKNTIIRKLSDMKKIFEKSIFLKRKIEKNKKIKLNDLEFKKPGDGIKAYNYKNIIGLKLKKTLPSGYKLKNNNFKK
ncbi:N-acetylneuraminate synthase family protein [Candidatus Pelagibacter communis]|uniref:N-acetylneuraminate synthase family protein n=1 Tax=Pelagibacter ubique TaxID=198252 RepID=UPI00094DC6C5|nr:N-acetylneuraminate synthase family protein [Candidatus Pelagibacter ubique]